MNTVVLVIAGLAGLVIGGEMLVRGAVSAARSFNVPPMVIGLTLVGFGTSTPELVTSLQAALSGSPGIALGNVIGSNIGNILLILGFTALLAPVAVDARAFRRDGLVMIVATLMCLAVVLVGDAGHLTGVVFVLTLLAYLAFTFWSEKGKTNSAAAAVYEAEAEAVPGPDHALGASLAITLTGLVFTILGARLLVSGAVSIAQAAGISETVIGLTIVAIGTSMPEFVTSIIAVRKGQGDVALGNVLGSNIFNILGILGITALVQPMAVPPEIIRLDIWVMCAATVLLLVFARTGWHVGRREGGAMLVCYLGYLAWLLG
ncbi:sodium:calcium antiporter [Roseovarius sp. TE539]|uniref:calcium/sodium antiporter n=1 Tax=Roseovarius sp. TE539 TaxID=2249812 RepID=UPI000DE0BC66|nr:calcium/sodium antiporter [Roseovarius sp. TE539]RBI72350.1 sodium:calcium antiporter [Roseovarius sp. TE539]